MKTCNRKTQVTDALKELQKIPGIGVRLGQDLVDLGYRNIIDLKGESPDDMYQNLMALRGTHVDRCVLYVFRCAAYYANNTIHDPELLKWWNWKDNKSDNHKRHRKH